MSQLSSFFYKNLEKSTPKLDSFINEFFEYAVNNQFQIYIMDRPLMEKETDYDTDRFILILSPFHAVTIVSLDNSKDTDEFEEIVDYLIEDIGYLGKKFKYNDVIGRPNKWRKYLKKFNFKELELLDSEEELYSFFKGIEYTDSEEKRKVDLIISLITGSINDISKIGNEVPETLLEKIRKKIVLFDGDQTRFIYEELSQDIVKIQGLAGTGKTELLLHRLKELYTENETNRIAFTCHNIALANKLKSRVPEFFDFMKVEEQIKWNERLWVFHGWGSKRNLNNLGLYSLICSIYQLPFFNAGEGSFQSACKKSLAHLLKLEENNVEIKPYFDYILVDEAQDFPEEFIQLCQKATSKTLYLAGDIFQDIFDMQELASEPDFSLNKVYRTHPKNLMFSHAVGMGLFEQPTITWLEENGWDACGYITEFEGRKYKLTREAILRFQELEMEGLDYTKIIKIPQSEIMIGIISTIYEIKAKHPDVRPEDIAVIFTKERLSKHDYEFVTYLEANLFSEFGWNSSVTYKDKKVEKDKIIISNKNNIKGLEFPFVICVVNNKITRNFAERNTLYMALTRSFLTSYLIIQEEYNEEILTNFTNGLEIIKRENAIYTLEPTSEEKALQKRRLNDIKQPKKSQYEVLYEIFSKLDLDHVDQSRIQSAIGALNAQTTDYRALEKLVLSMLEV